MRRDIFKIDQIFQPIKSLQFEPNAYCTYRVHGEIHIVEFVKSNFLFGTKLETFMNFDLFGLHVQVQKVHTKQFPHHQNGLGKALGDHDKVHGGVKLSQVVLNVWVIVISHVVHAHLEGLKVFGSKGPRQGLVEAVGDAIDILLKMLICTAQHLEERCADTRQIAKMIFDLFFFVISPVEEVEHRFVMRKRLSNTIKHVMIGSINNRKKADMSTRFIFLQKKDAVLFKV